MQAVFNNGQIITEAQAKEITENGMGSCAGLGEDDAYEKDVLIDLPTN